MIHTNNDTVLVWIYVLLGLESFKQYIGFLWIWWLLVYRGGLGASQRRSFFSHWSTEKNWILYIYRWHMRIPCIVILWYHIHWKTQFNKIYLFSRRYFSITTLHACDKINFALKKISLHFLYQCQSINATKESFSLNQYIISFFTWISLYTQDGINTGFKPCVLFLLLLLIEKK